MPYPNGCEDAVREDERQQEITNAVEEAVYPYKQCIEDVHEYATDFVDALRDLCKREPEIKDFGRALIAANTRLEAIDRAIDKHGIREELDL